MSDQELLQRAARCRDHQSLDSLSVDAVAEVARTQGTDFATALLYTRITQSERFAPCIEWIRRAPARWPSSRLSPLIAIVPGAFHSEPMDTGADGRRFLQIAHASGFRTEVVPTHSFGSLNQNAGVVAEWLSSHDGDEIILVALSKAAAEVACLLHDGNTFLLRSVMAVVNLSPLLFGTPLVDRVLDHPLRSLVLQSLMWCRNYDFGNFNELRYHPNRAASITSPVPILNVSGFPLECHLSSPMARRQYRRLRDYGPSDGGGVLLADVVHYPGALFPVWGADHYLRYPEKLPELLGQALCTVAVNDHWASTTVVTGGKASG